MMIPSSFEQVCLPDQLDKGDNGVHEEAEPENQVNLLVHYVYWQGAHSRYLCSAGVVILQEIFR